MGQLGGREFAQSGAVRHPGDGIAGVRNIPFQAPHQLVAIVPGDSGRQRVDIALRRFDRGHDRRAGAVGGFDAACLAERVAEQCRVGVADHRHDRNTVRNGGQSFGMAEEAARRFNVRQRRARNAEQRQHLVIPLAAVQVQQLGAGGIGVVAAEGFSSGQIPQQPAVDGAEANLTAFGTQVAIDSRIQQPAHFGGREQRGDWQAGGTLNVLFLTIVTQCVAERGAAGALPGNGRVNRFAAVAIPADGGFPLVADGQRGDVFRANVGHRAGDHRQ